MAIKVRFSTKYFAVKNRIKNLPKLTDGLISSKFKTDANNLIKFFQEGIRNESLGLRKLKPETSEAKKRQGLPMPDTPLYGRGDEIDKKTYINMLRIRKLKKGFKVQPSIAKHHKANLSLRQLFSVHELGRKIKVNRGGKEYIITIPPRPAFAKAFNVFLKSKSRRDNTQRVKRAITGFIKTGNKQILKNEQRFFESSQDKANEE